MTKKNNGEKVNVQQQVQEEETIRIYTPRQLYDYLNQYVVGQDEAKRTLSVAIYNHYKRIIANTSELSQDAPDELKELADVEIDKSNVMLIGNTGTGKTYMIRKLAEKLGIPCYVADATKFTQSGYVGDDVESVLVGLIKAANNDIYKAQYGICCIDEIDKIARKGENVSITRDVGGEGVQQSLLKIVEGGKVGVPPQGGRKHPEQELVFMDTTNILFIGMGAFDGLEKIIARRTNVKTIGFNRGENHSTEENDILSDIMSDDLKSFGFIPELIGRFPVITHTKELSKDDLVKIIKEPKNSILKQYKKLLLLDGVTISFTDGAIDAIAETALRLKIGARGLRRIMEKILNDVMFDYAGKEGTVINIDKKWVDDVFSTNKKIKKAA